MLFDLENVFDDEPYAADYINGTTIYADAGYSIAK